jgi:hypothetical protein
MKPYFKSLRWGWLAHLKGALPKPRSAAFTPHQRPATRQPIELPAPAHTLKRTEVRALRAVSFTRGCLALLLALLVPVARLAAQGTAFTYQGLLNNGAPANGVYNLEFTLYAASSGGAPLAGPVTNTGVVFATGLFSTLVDFGPGVFTGSSNWLEIAVQTNAGGPFVLLPPREQVSPEPYALYAENAGSVAATNLTGTLGLAQLPSVVLTNGSSGVSLTGVFTGNGGGLTNVSVQNANFGGAIGWTTNAGFTNFIFSFNLAGAFPVGPYPEGAVAVDVNGDGFVDLITANTGGGSLSVLTNNGSGYFATSGAFPVGNEPFAVATADVNGDGYPDLITANNADNTLTVLTNYGPGSFALSATLPVGNSPIAVAVADVNHDRWADLIAVNFVDDTLTILTNNGRGLFGLNTTLLVGDSPVGVAAADVNGDGWVDLISANSADNTLTVLLNNGQGGFPGSAIYAVGANPNCVIAADVNGDGWPDLIAANYGDNTVTVLTNNRAGTFGLSGTYPVGPGPSFVAAANVKGYGLPDLITANQDGNGLTVLTNDGTGNFGLAGSLATASPVTVLAADVNGDGRPDLIAANELGGSLTVFTNSSTLSLNPGGGGPVASFSGTYFGSGTGLTNVPPAAITGGLTASLPVLVPGGRTNTLIFQNGILIKIQAY